MPQSSPQNETLVRSSGSGVELCITVLPRSSRSIIVGIQDHRLKLKITSPPVDGQANAACCSLLAEFFGMPASAVTVVRGHTARKKTVRIEGLNCASVQVALCPDDR